MATVNSIINSAVATGPGGSASVGAVMGPSSAVSAASTAQTAASSASAGDYQAALNTFGNLVKSSFQGKKFGTEDLGRLEDAVQKRLNDPNVSQGEKVALRKIFDEFKASNTEQDSSAVGAPDWATFLSKIGTILKSVPGAEKIGDALINLSGMIADSNKEGDSTFDRNDIGSLRRRSEVWRDVGRGNVPDLAQRLIGGGRPEDGGSVINAANFGSLLSGLSLGTPASAAAGLPAAPQPSAAAVGAPVNHIAIDNLTLNNNWASLPSDWAKAFDSPTLDMTAAWRSPEQTPGAG